MNIYQGDPKINITENGAEINFPGNAGQPEMEQGVENLAILSLFTKQKWEGNFYFKNADNKIGSDYEKTSQLPITLSNIELLRQSTIRSLGNKAFGSVNSDVTVPSSNGWKNVIDIKPPGKDSQEIILQKNGLNWILQKLKDSE